MVQLNPGGGGGILSPVSCFTYGRVYKGCKHKLLADRQYFRSLQFVTHSRSVVLKSISNNIIIIL